MQTLPTSIIGSSLHDEGNEMAEIIISNKNPVFYGRCRVCDTFFKESVSVISKDIAVGEHSLFAHINCPVCQNLTAVYPEDVFAGMEKKFKIFLDRNEEV